MPPDFSKRLLVWYDHPGNKGRRRGLPWQTDKTPYRVWVSEIMLQQTRVQTVVPYFERFIERFPSPAALAAAPRDEVLRRWAGLGYYARARNLHLAARRVCEQFGGEVPRRFEELISLPGVGRSTAGAILALCFDRRLPILDGNVKRVLARHRDVAGRPDEAAVAKRLWALSESLLPHKRIGDYTQAIMDLGAVVCTRTSAQCNSCPVAQDCKARIKGCVAERPAKRPVKSPKPARTTVMLIVTRDGKVLLERRPAAGVWGGLLCLPEVARLSDVAPWRRRLGLEGETTRWDDLAHEFTHFKLKIKPVSVRCNRRPLRVSERDDFFWYTIRDAQNAGVPAPVRKLLTRLDRTKPRKTERWNAPFNAES